MSQANDAKKNRMLSTEVQKGLDPLGVIRDPDHPMIDTNLIQSITMKYPAGIFTETVEVDGSKYANRTTVGLT